MRNRVRRLQFLSMILILFGASGLSGQVVKTPEADVSPGRDGMVVAIDKATGELRQPTANEAAAFTRTSREPVRQLKVSRTSGGAVMIELDESFLDYFTIRLADDGSLHPAFSRGDQLVTILRLPVRTAPVMVEK